MDCRAVLVMPGGCRLGFRGVSGLGICLGLGFRDLGFGV